MAEAIARARVAELGWKHVEVASAGVAASPNSPATDGAVLAARSRGYDLSGHGATLLTREVADEADLILTMSAAHLARVHELGAADRGAMITMFGNEESDDDALAGVPDPFGGPIEEYILTLEALDALVTRALRALEPVIEP